MLTSLNPLRIGPYDDGRSTRYVGGNPQLRIFRPRRALHIHPSLGIAVKATSAAGHVRDSLNIGQITDVSQPAWK